LTGNLILDAKNKEDHSLLDLSLYKIENKNLNLILVSNVASYTISSNFRTLVVDLKQKLNPSLQSKDTPLTSEIAYLVIFENELSFDEINQIRLAISSTLKIPLEDVMLLFSENNKYTLKIKTSNSPFNLLKDVVFVKGPYQNKINENEMIFSPYTEDNFQEKSSAGNLEP
jgi:hypothetical protein